MNTQPITYRWNQEDHDPLDGNHTESPEAITVVLSPAVQERIEQCRDALGMLSTSTPPFEEGGIVSMQLRFESFGVTGYGGKVRGGMLEVSRTWVYLNFYDDWSGEFFELALGDDLLETTA